MYGSGYDVELMLGREGKGRAEWGSRRARAVQFDGSRGCNGNRVHDFRVWCEYVEL